VFSRLEGGQEIWTGLLPLSSLQPLRSAPIDMYVPTSEVRPRRSFRPDSVLLSEHRIADNVFGAQFDVKS